MQSSTPSAPSSSSAAGDPLLHPSVNPSAPSHATPSTGTTASPPLTSPIATAEPHSARTAAAAESSSTASSPVPAARRAPHAGIAAPSSEGGGSRGVVRVLPATQTDADSSTSFRHESAHISSRRPLQLRQSPSLSPSSASVSASAGAAPVFAVRGVSSEEGRGGEGSDLPHHTGAARATGESTAPQYAHTYGNSQSLLSASGSHRWPQQPHHSACSVGDIPRGVKGKGGGRGGRGLTTITGQSPLSSRRPSSTASAPAAFSAGTAASTSTSHGRKLSRKVEGAIGEPELAPLYNLNARSTRHPHRLYVRVAASASSSIGEKEPSPDAAAATVVDSPSGEATSTSRAPSDPSKLPPSRPLTRSTDWSGREAPVGAPFRARGASTTSIPRPTAGESFFAEALRTDPSFLMSSSHTRGERGSMDAAAMRGGEDVMRQSEQDAEMHEATVTGLPPASFTNVHFHVDSVADERAEALPSTVERGPGHDTEVNEGLRTPPQHRSSVVMEEDEGEGANDDNDDVSELSEMEEESMFDETPPRPLTAANARRGDGDGDGNNASSLSPSASPVPVQPSNLTQTDLSGMLYTSQETTGVRTEGNRREDGGKVGEEGEGRGASDEDSQHAVEAKRAATHVGGEGEYDHSKEAAASAVPLATEIAQEGQRLPLYDSSGGRRRSASGSTRTLVSPAYSPPSPPRPPSRSSTPSSSSSSAHGVRDKAESTQPTTTVVEALGHSDEKAAHSAGGNAVAARSAVVAEQEEEENDSVPPHGARTRSPPGFSPLSSSTSGAAQQQSPPPLPPALFSPFSSSLTTSQPERHQRHVREGEEQQVEGGGETLGEHLARAQERPKVESERATYVSEAIESVSASVAHTSEEADGEAGRLPPQPTSSQAAPGEAQLQPGTVKEAHSIAENGENGGDSGDNDDAQSEQPPFANTMIEVSALTSLGSCTPHTTPLARALPQSLITDSTAPPHAARVARRLSASASSSSSSSSSHHTVSTVSDGAQHARRVPQMAFTEMEEEDGEGPHTNTATTATYRRGGAEDDEEGEEDEDSTHHTSTSARHVPTQSAAEAEAITAPNQEDAHADVVHSLPPYDERESVRAVAVAQQPHAEVQHPHSSRRSSVDSSNESKEEEAEMPAVMASVLNITYDGTVSALSDGEAHTEGSVAGHPSAPQLSFPPPHSPSPRISSDGGPTAEHAVEEEGVSATHHKQEARGVQSTQRALEPELAAASEAVPVSSSSPNAHASLVVPSKSDVATTRQEAVPAETAVAHSVPHRMTTAFLSSSSSSVESNASSSPPSVPGGAPASASTTLTESVAKLEQIDQSAERALSEHGFASHSGIDRDGEEVVPSPPPSSSSTPSLPTAAKAHSHSTHRSRSRSAGHESRASSRPSLKEELVKSVELPAVVEEEDDDDEDDHRGDKAVGLNTSPSRTSPPPPPLTTTGIVVVESEQHTQLSDAQPAHEHPSTHSRADHDAPSVPLPSSTMEAATEEVGTAHRRPLAGPLMPPTPHTTTSSTSSSQAIAGAIPSEEREGEEGPADAVHVPAVVSSHSMHSAADSATSEQEARRSTGSHTSLVERSGSSEGSAQRDEGRRGPRASSVLIMASTPSPPPRLQDEDDDDEEDDKVVGDSAPRQTENEVKEALQPPSGVNNDSVPEDVNRATPGERAVYLAQKTIPPIEKADVNPRHDEAKGYAEREEGVEAVVVQRSEGAAADHAHTSTETARVALLNEDEREEAEEEGEDEDTSFFGTHNEARGPRKELDSETRVQQEQGCENEGVEAAPHRQLPLLPPSSDAVLDEEQSAPDPRATTHRSPSASQTEYETAATATVAQTSSETVEGRQGVPHTVPSAVTDHVTTAASSSALARPLLPSSSSKTSLSHSSPALRGSPHPPRPSPSPPPLPNAAAAAGATAGGEGKKAEAQGSAPAPRSEPPLQKEEEEKHQQLAGHGMTAAPTEGQHEERRSSASTGSVTSVRSGRLSVSSGTSSASFRRHEFRRPSEPLPPPQQRNATEEEPMATVLESTTVVEDGDAPGSPRSIPAQGGSLTPTTSSSASASAGHPNQTSATESDKASQRSPNTVSASHETKLAVSSAGVAVRATRIEERVAAPPAVASPSSAVSTSSTSVAFLETDPTDAEAEERGEEQHAEVREQPQHHVARGAVNRNATDDHHNEEEVEEEEGGSTGGAGTAADLPPSSSQAGSSSSLCFATDEQSETLPRSGEARRAAEGRPSANPSAEHVAHPPASPSDGDVETTEDVSFEVIEDEDGSEGEDDVPHGAAPSAAAASAVPVDATRKDGRLHAHRSDRDLSPEAVPPSRPSSERSSTSGPPIPPAEVPATTAVVSAENTAGEAVLPKPHPLPNANPPTRSLTNSTPMPHSPFMEQEEELTAGAGAAVDGHYTEDDEESAIADEDGNGEEEEEEDAHDHTMKAAEREAPHATHGRDNGEDVAHHSAPSSTYSRGSSHRKRTRSAAAVARGAEKNEEEEGGGSSPDVESEVESIADDALREQEGDDDANATAAQPPPPPASGDTLTAGNVVPNTVMTDKAERANVEPGVSRTTQRTAAEEREGVQGEAKRSEGSVDHVPTQAQRSLQWTSSSSSATQHESSSPASSSVAKSAAAMNEASQPRASADTANPATVTTPPDATTHAAQVRSTNRPLFISPPTPTTTVPTSSSSSSSSRAASATSMAEVVAVESLTEDDTTMARAPAATTTIATVSQPQPVVSRATAQTATATSTTSARGVDRERAPLRVSESATMPPFTSSSSSSTALAAPTQWKEANGGLPEKAPRREEKKAEADIAEGEGGDAKGTPRAGNDSSGGEDSDHEGVPTDEELRHLSENAFGRAGQQHRQLRRSEEAAAATRGSEGRIRTFVPMESSTTSPTHTHSKRETSTVEGNGKPSVATPPTSTSLFSSSSVHFASGGGGASERHTQKVATPKTNAAIAAPAIPSSASSSPSSADGLVDRASGEQTHSVRWMPFAQERAKAAKCPAAEPTEAPSRLLSSPADKVSSANVKEEEREGRETEEPSAPTARSAPSTTQLVHHFHEVQLRKHLHEVEAMEEEARQALLEEFVDDRLAVQMEEAFAYGCVASGWHKSLPGGDHNAHHQAQHQRRADAAGGTRFAPQPTGISPFTTSSASRSPYRTATPPPPSSHRTPLATASIERGVTYDVASFTPSVAARRVNQRSPPRPLFPTPTGIVNSAFLSPSMAPHSSSDSDTASHTTGSHGKGASTRATPVSSSANAVLAKRATASPRDDAALAIVPSTAPLSGEQAAAHCGGTAMLEAVGALLDDVKAQSMTTSTLVTALVADELLFRRFIAEQETQANYLLLRLHQCVVDAFQPAYIYAQEESEWSAIMAEARRDLARLREWNEYATLDEEIRALREVTHHIAVLIETETQQRASTVPVQEATERAELTKLFHCGVAGLVRQEDVLRSALRVELRQALEDTVYGERRTREEVRVAEVRARASLYEKAAQVLCIDDMHRQQHVHALLRSSSHDSEHTGEEEVEEVVSLDDDDFAAVQAAVALDEHGDDGDGARLPLQSRRKGYSESRSSIVFSEEEQEEEEQDGRVPSKTPRLLPRRGGERGGGMDAGGSQPKASRKESPASHSSSSPQRARQAVVEASRHPYNVVNQPDTAEGEGERREAVGWKRSSNSEDAAVADGDVETSHTSVSFDFFEWNPTHNTDRTGGSNTHMTTTSSTLNTSAGDEAQQLRKQKEKHHRDAPPRHGSGDGRQASPSPQGHSSLALVTSSTSGNSDGHRNKGHDLSACVTHDDDDGACVNGEGAQNKVKREKQRAVSGTTVSTTSPEQTRSPTRLAGSPRTIQAQTLLRALRMTEAAVGEQNTTQKNRTGSARVRHHGRHPYAEDVHDAHEDGDNDKDNDNNKLKGNVKEEEEERKALQRKRGHLRSPHRPHQKHRSSSSSPLLAQSAATGEKVDARKRAPHHRKGTEEEEEEESVDVRSDSKYSEVKGDHTLTRSPAEETAKPSPSPLRHHRPGGNRTFRSPSHEPEKVGLGMAVKTENAQPSAAAHGIAFHIPTSPRLNRHIIPCSLRDSPSKSYDALLAKYGATSRERSGGGRGASQSPHSPYLSPRQSSQSRSRSEGGRGGARRSHSGRLPPSRPYEDSDVYAVDPRRVYVCEVSDSPTAAHSNQIVAQIMAASSGDAVAAAAAATTAATEMENTEQRERECSEGSERTQKPSTSAAQAAKPNTEREEQAKPSACPVADGGDGADECTPISPPFRPQHRELFPSTSSSTDAAVHSGTAKEGGPPPSSHLVSAREQRARGGSSGATHDDHPTSKTVSPFAVRPSTTATAAPGTTAMYGDIAATRWNSVSISPSSSPARSPQRLLLHRERPPSAPQVIEVITNSPPRQWTVSASTASPAGHAGSSSRGRSRTQSSGRHGGGHSGAADAAPHYLAPTATSQRQRQETQLVQLLKSEATPALHGSGRASRATSHRAYTPTRRGASGEDSSRRPSRPHTSRSILLSSSTTASVQRFDNEDVDDGAPFITCSRSRRADFTGKAVAGLSAPRTHHSSTSNGAYDAVDDAAEKPPAPVLITRLPLSEGPGVWMASQGGRNPYGFDAPAQRALEATAKRDPAPHTITATTQPSRREQRTQQTPPPPLRPLRSASHERPPTARGRSGTPTHGRDQSQKEEEEEKTVRPPLSSSRQPQRGATTSQAHARPISGERPRTTSHSSRQSPSRPRQAAPASESDVSNAEAADELEDAFAQAHGGVVYLPPSIRRAFTVPQHVALRAPSPSDADVQNPVPADWDSVRDSRVAPFPKGSVALPPPHPSPSPSTRRGTRDSNGHVSEAQLPRGDVAVSTTPVTAAATRTVPSHNTVRATYRPSRRVDLLPGTASGAAVGGSQRGYSYVDSFYKQTPEALRQRCAAVAPHASAAHADGAMPANALPWNELSPTTPYDPSPADLLSRELDSGSDTDEVFERAIRDNNTYTNRAAEWNGVVDGLRPASRATDLVEHADGFGEDEMGDEYDCDDGAVAYPVRDTYASLLRQQHRHHPPSSGPLAGAPRLRGDLSYTSQQGRPPYPVQIPPRTGVSQPQQQQQQERATSRGGPHRYATVPPSAAAIASGGAVEVLNGRPARPHRYA